MRTLYTLLCVLAINVVQIKAGLNDYLHDYVKDGRPVDGPFPANLKNMPYMCYQVPSKGPCSNMQVAWFYDIVRRRCMRMFYSGCGGNENKFATQRSCELTCNKDRAM
ncbi:kunitz-type serine protease inhibitor textilinin-5-like [Helicoverpa zea]|uniref:kunitz-type serine protease inhibitor textilinin-5-like n=1 Tax=Helicoverpa zea TaxID=7113 RepID=UPI001F5A54AD|nr:kunitz-type serine protease inhibitor textilinin-5-like [Helicoverpa zea]